VTFAYQGSDTDGTVTGYYYSFDVDPPDTWTAGTTVTSGVLGEGGHVFRVAAQDDDGALSPIVSRTFYVSSAEPPVFYTASAFDLSPALIDSNQKVDLDVGVAKLQLFQDLFGSVLDAHWTVGKLPHTGWSSTENGTVVESGGQCQITAIAPVEFGYYEKGIYTGLLFGDLTVSMDVASATMPWEDWKATYMSIFIDVNSNNYVWLCRYRDKTAGVDCIGYQKCVGGIKTDIGRIITSVLTFKLRIVRSGNDFWCYYDIGSGWTLMPGNPFTAAIGTPARVYVMCMSKTWCTTIADVESITITGSGVYWNDSPEIYVINGPGDEFAFDAGAGKTWSLSGASAVLSEPGTSTVKFKVGVSDTGLIADVTWIDALWQTAAQVNANAAGGLYDGRRYVHVKAQFGSDGTDQPTLSSFSILGVKAP
jgi:hypothetical protein